MGRYHLCAQHVAGGVAKDFFPYIHCMFMNNDLLKCGQNTHCNTPEASAAAIALVAPVCAQLTGMDHVTMLFVKWAVAELPNLTRNTWSTSVFVWWASDVVVVWGGRRWRESGLVEWFGRKV